MYLNSKQMHHCLFEKPFPFVHNKQATLSVLQLWASLAWRHSPIFHFHSIYICVCVCVYINQYNLSGKTTVHLLATNLLKSINQIKNQNQFYITYLNHFPPYAKHALPEHLNARRTAHKESQLHS